MTYVHFMYSIACFSIEAKNIQSIFIEENSLQKIIGKQINKLDGYPIRQGMRENCQGPLIMYTKNTAD